MPQDARNATDESHKTSPLRFEEEVMLQSA